MSTPPILDLLGLNPSAESLDYVRNKGQFHLHGLLTEQRHERTWDLGATVERDVEAGLRAILAVEEDVCHRLAALAGAPQPLEQAAAAVVQAVSQGRRIYVYGCGATGRLAKMMESSFWRPFWRRVDRLGLGDVLAARLPARIGDLLVGEMTGADRALVSSLEGFEDLMQVGELQLRDHGIEPGDVVFCVTEGGETSSVIGTILAALGQYRELDAAQRCAAAQRLYFVYNNPDEVLRPFERSRAVLDEPGITKINLATGPQAIAGSTRMQATTVETLVVGVVLEEAIFRLLRPCLDAAQLASLGFGGDPGIAGRLQSCAGIRAAVEARVTDLARLTELEASTYRRGDRATYFAEAAMVTVFTDCTERSPTFRLFPLDAVDLPERRCWVQVWTAGEDAAEAWRNFLGRRFRGLDPRFYRAPLGEVADPYLRRAALSSLAQAGDDQQDRYDFSLSPRNLGDRGPSTGDLGVLVALGEESDALTREGSPFHRVHALFRDRAARLAVIHVGCGETVTGTDADVTVSVELPPGDDPIALRRQVALKILLNAHSTATMARLGRVVGNTMTNVSPSNLKLIGRATFLIQSHVNDVCARPGFVEAHGTFDPIDFAEANAVLFDAMEWVASGGVEQTAEVALSIIRILECRSCGAAQDFAGAADLLQAEGLAGYLCRFR